MREDDIEAVKALIKVCMIQQCCWESCSFPPRWCLKHPPWCLQEGCEGTENRLILHILTRPLCLFILAVFSSILRCLVHSFILALAIPVFLLIVFLKITMPRSAGVLGSSRPYWDYVGSSHRGTQDETLQNPYARVSGKTPVTKAVSLHFLLFSVLVLMRKRSSQIHFNSCRSAQTQTWNQGEGVSREDHP